MFRPSNPESLKPLEDTSAEVERIFLWGAVKKLFNEQADTVGIQADYRFNKAPDQAVEYVVLVSPTPAPEVPESTSTNRAFNAIVANLIDLETVNDAEVEPVESPCDIKVWGELQPGLGVTHATIVYGDADTGRELWTYHIAESGMDQSVPSYLGPTLMDAEDIAGIRRDLESANWNPVASQQYAANTMFWAS